MAQRKPSKLTRTITLLYSYQDDDIDALADELLDMRKNAYRNTMTELAKQAGFPRARGKFPSGKELAAMQKQARVDAVGIAKTHNDAVGKAIMQQFEDNPRSNRNTYYKNLEQWSAKRDEWKKPQIAMMQDSAATQDATELFIKANNAQAMYRLEGASPKEEGCAKLMAMGEVDDSVIRKNPMPLHINCPHKWKAVGLKVPPDVEKVFVG